MYRFLDDYEIEAIEVPGEPDAVLVPAFQYEYRLKRFAAFQRKYEHNLQMSPQVVHKPDGNPWYVLMPRSDFETLADALPTPEFLFHTKFHDDRRGKRGKKYEAWGSLMDDGMFFVYGGSLIAKDAAKSLNSEYSRIRRRLIESSKVRDRFDHFKLIEDEQFKTPAEAAAVVTGYNRGNNVWINWYGSTMPATGSRDRTD